MAKSDLERRVASLEKQVSAPQTFLAQPHPHERKKDIRNLIGIFDDDEVMGEIFAEALKYRERDRGKVARQ